MLRANPKRRCAINKLLEMNLFREFGQDIQRGLSTEEVNILKENYKLNVQSTKRVGPKVLEEFINQDDFFNSVFESTQHIQLRDIEQFSQEKNVRTSLEEEFQWREGRS